MPARNSDFTIEKGELKTARRNVDEPPKPKFVKPYEPENLHMSRDEYVKKQQEKAEARAKTEAYAKSLEGKDMEVKAEDAPEEKVEEKKKTGRPKKIED